MRFTLGIIGRGACALLASMLALTILSAPSAARADERLPRDDNNVYGQLDNGVKYIIRTNANPPGRAMLFLHVKTGAINESDDQNGLAHFLEHMAFNGSKHFEPGKLIPLLNSLGMTFGADTNAHTSWWETVYKLNMPDTKPETIETALKILGDYADGLTLSEAEVEKERKVILEESRAGKGAYERLERLENRAIFAGTKIAIHDVIGDDEQIKVFTRDQFADYWNAWYRPENMTLLIVGDVKPDQVLPTAKKWLGGFKARGDGATREAAKAGIKPTTEPRAFVLTDPEQVAGEVKMIAVQPGRPAVKNLEQFRADLIENIGPRIVGRRLDEMNAKGGAPFRYAFAYVGNTLEESIEPQAYASGEPADWNKNLDVLITEISRAIDHGFTPNELELVKRSMLSSAEEAVKTESSRTNDWVIYSLMNAVTEELPILSAAQRLELTKRVLETVTLEEVHRAFVTPFKTKNYNYVVRMPEKKDGLTLPSTEDVLSAASAAWARRAEAPVEAPLAERLLPIEPQPGEVATRESDADLKLTTVTFANGVVMHHMFNDYKKNQIQIYITMPGGTIAETADTRGLGDCATTMLFQPATSRFTSTQIRDLMTGKQARMFGFVGEDALSLLANGNPKDIPYAMQLVHAIITDGVLEQSAVDEWRKSTRERIKELKLHPWGAMQEAMAETFYGGDVRYRPLTEADVERTQRDAAEAWMKKILGTAAIEVAVVGEISLNDATNLVARYLGSLPPRTGKFDSLDKFRKLDRPAGPYAKSVTYATVTPKAAVNVGFVGCDHRSPDRRPLSLAAQVISDRMNERIREKEGLVYSIDAYSSPGVEMPGTGMFVSSSTCDPANAERLADVIVEMMREFARSGPTEDELATAKKQKATELATTMKEPGYWAGAFASQRYRGVPLAEIKEVPAIFQTFTAKDLQDVVAKYLADDKILRYVIIPQAKSAADQGPTTAPSKMENEQTTSSGTK